MNDVFAKKLTEQCSTMPHELVSKTYTLHLLLASQDAKDDARAGVRSSALALGKRTKPFLIGCGALLVFSWSKQTLLCWGKSKWPGPPQLNRLL
eukprot:1814496-Pleurochrysis_carterae.AAC.1